MPRISKLSCCTHCSRTRIMNNMKKRLFVILLIVLLVAFTVPTVNAHPGRTDSKGGHTNHSTGEYHYHHGYSAHNHYDMDGDGSVDCPYDFDDKTDHDGGGYGYASPTEEVVKETEEKTEEETEDSKLSEYQKRYEIAQKRKKISKILRIVLGICYIPLTWLVFYLFIRFT